MPMHVRRSGSWTPVLNTWIKVSGTWVKPHTIHARDLGVWEVIHTGLLSLANLTVSNLQSPGPYNNNAGVRLLGTTATIGKQQTLSEAGTVWSDLSGYLMPTGDTVLADNYEARLTKTGGFTPAGSALSTWLALTADRTWTLNRSAVGTSTFTGLLEVREIALPSNLVSSTMNWTLRNETLD